eukprot:4835612-Alexandrium_andersonii.AAC.1
MRRRQIAVRLRQAGRHCGRSGRALRPWSPRQLAKHRAANQVRLGPGNPGCSTWRHHQSQ